MARPKGGYRTADGKMVPGVTTIIGRFKDSGGLLWWAYEQGKSAQRGEISSLYDKRDEAADAGTIAHELIEMHLIGVSRKITCDIEWVINKFRCSEAVAWQALQGYQNALNWLQTTNIEIIETEVSLVSDKYKFGGTLDAIAYHNKQLAIGDFKTSNAVYPDYLIQLAAYKHLWESSHPDDPITGGFHLLRFAKETADFAHHYYAELNDAWEQFLLFRKAYDIDKKLKKRV